MKPCLILASSPSVDAAEGLFDALGSFYTIGVSEWAAGDIALDAYVINHTMSFIKEGGAVNKQGVDNTRRLLETDKLKLIKDSAHVEASCRLGGNTYGLHFHNYEKAAIESIPALSPLVPTTGTGTVTRCALDLALYLGYTDISIIGMDMKRSVPGYSERLSPFLNSYAEERYGVPCYFDSDSLKGHERIWKQRIEANKDKSIVSISPYGRPADWSWFPHKQLFRMFKSVGTSAKYRRVGKVLVPYGLKLAGES